MTPSERERLIEKVARAERARDPFGALKPEPAFFDLDAEARRVAHEQARLSRQLEALLDADGLSTMGHAVLARIRSA